MRIDRVKLITEMAKQNIGVAELAEKAGVSRVTVTSLRGGKSCSENSVRCIAAALGVTVEDLQAGETHDAPKAECGKESKKPWVEAWYTGEKWADGTDVVKVTMDGNTGELINLICTLATVLMEDHARQNADKNHQSLHHAFRAYVRKFLETSITALRPQERAGPSVAAGQGTCWRLVA